MNLCCLPARSLQGEISLPGDKSISHRAVMLGAIAQGKTRIKNFLQGQDCLATARIMQQLGITIEIADEALIVHGAGLKGLRPSPIPLDCGNSGTSMRLLAGLLAAQPFTSLLQGDASLMKRPMERILKPLREMGANLSGLNQGDQIFPPLKIEKTTHLQGITYTLPVASAQVKSCLLLAGLYASGATTVREKQATRDHTERLLQAFGCSLDIQQSAITLTPATVLSAQEIAVPGDFSAAAFFIVGASITPGSHVILRQVGINPHRTGLLKILQQMGADISLDQKSSLGNEPIADLEIRGSQLKGTVVPCAWVASAIDEFPILFIAAAAAHGDTIFSGLQELRYKESDRIETMAQGLRQLGVEVETSSDGMRVRGQEAFHGGVVDSQGDHRVAMAFAIASLKAQKPIFIQRSENIVTSFPNFIPLAHTLGLNLQLS